ASQEILFKDDLGKDIFKLRYSEISKCRVRSSRIAMITGGSFLCYLGLFKKGDPQEYATFMFNSRAYFYAKDLCSQISVKIKGAV
ncbi:MAG: hypothetical protein NTY47_06065, partial [Candidatus Omnitrophica bacterium]|nr:hypothetical protein [Candidatus Omnitrophota bacterium]